MDEIERKFILTQDQKIDLVRGLPQHVCITQAYLGNNQYCDVRVRIESFYEKTPPVEANITIKSKSTSSVRTESITPIGVTEAKSLVALIPKEQHIRKVRYIIEGEYEDVLTEQNPLCVSIDEFHGANEGLYLAEIEMYNQDVDITKYVKMFGEEVTHDKRFYNSYLSEHPFSEWCDV